MSLNEEQLDYLRSLGKIPPDERCWCAWFRLGECPHCPPSKTLAQRLLVQCPDPRCQNYPDPLGLYPITHNIKCQAVTPPPNNRSTT